MRFVATLCALAVGGAASSPASTLSGTVVGEGAQVVPGARVFLEAGLGAPLIVTSSGPDGTFSFTDVPAGLAGVFAIAEGYAFGGRSQKVTLEDDAAGIEITLRRPGAVTGRVTNFKGLPVAGARVTRVLLQDHDKVGIPLAKLAEFGFAEPSSDDNGRFAVSNLPAGGTVALKVGHPSYAQQGVSDVIVGSQDVQVQLSEGVTVRGLVLSRDGSLAVANAAIIIQTARPPHDTAVTRTDASGQFLIKLNPGVYLYQAASMELRSPGWEKLTVTGTEPMQNVSLRVAGTGRIYGDVRDPRSGSPLAGAKLYLTAFGSPAAVATTGPSGAFAFAAAEGENSVRVEPAPGYARPERNVISVMVKQGDNIELPTYWLSPLPGYSVTIVDSDQKPVPGALVRLIRPTQYRWQTANSSGRVRLEIAQAPVSGKIIGMAESPSTAEGAVFSLDAQQAVDATVQLLPYAKVSGMAVTTKDKPIEGAIVGALFQSDSDDEPLPLWRTVTGAGGVFSWPAMVPYLPAACLVSTGPEAFGRSMPFNVEPGSSKDLGRIVVTTGEKGDKPLKQQKGLAGKKIPWYENRLLSGTLPATDSLRAGQRAVVVYTSPAEAPMIVDALAGMREALRAENTVFAAIVEGPFSGEASGVVVLQGSPPGPATTYLLDAEGKVVLETAGMPPAWAIYSLVSYAQG